MELYSVEFTEKRKLFTVTNHKEVTTKYIIFGKKPY